MPEKNLLVTNDSIIEDTLDYSGMQYTYRSNTAGGESREEAEKRCEKEKELKRLEKLMRYAFPRQREEYNYRKRLLPPDAFNMSVDLLKLKKESMRLDHEKETMQSSIKL